MTDKYPSPTAPRLVALLVVLAALVLSGCGKELGRSEELGRRHSERCSLQAGQTAGVVPDVWGMSLTNAKSRLCTSGFPSVMAHQASGAAPTGHDYAWTVAQQNPAPGQTLSPDHQVRLFVIPRQPAAVSSTTAPEAPPPPTDRPSLRDDYAAQGPGYLAAFDGGYSLCLQSSPEELAARYGVAFDEVEVMQAIQTDYERDFANSPEGTLLAIAVVDGCLEGWTAAGFD